MPYVKTVVADAHIGQWDDVGIIPYKLLPSTS